MKLKFKKFKLPVLAALYTLLFLMMCTFAVNKYSRPKAKIKWTGNSEIIDSLIHVNHKLINP